MLSLSISIDDSAFSRFTEGLLVSFSNIQSGPMRDGVNAAGKTLLEFERRRFDSESKGGGDWPDLAFSTKLARMHRGNKTPRGSGGSKTRGAKSRGMQARQGGESKKSLAAGMHFDILRNTGQLYATLAGGSLFEPLSDGIRVGTADRVAAFHQEGGPHLPKRPIIVPPDEGTLNAIHSILSSAVEATLQQMKAP